MTTLVDVALAGGPACAWCGGPMSEVSDTGRRRREDAVTCSRKCRQRRHAARVDQARLEAAARPMRFAYADPPYPGRARLYPENAEVDHRQLIADLEQEFPDGWALSTAADRLQAVLALCPDGVRIASWHRAVRRVPSAVPLSAWEPLIVRGGRELPRDTPQVVTNALDARGRHRSHPKALVGMKPPAFCVWMFEQLGACPGDELVDVFPGSGVVGQTWYQYAGGDQASLAT